MLFSSGVRDDNQPFTYRIAIMVQLFYVDLWKPIKKHLDNMPFDYDLYVNLTDGFHDKEDVEKIEKHPNTTVFHCANLGLDIGGFVNTINQVDLEKYDLVCKIHTKKSRHRIDGKAWRIDLYDTLLGSGARIENICQLFCNFPKVGILGSARHNYCDPKNQGVNYKSLTKIYEKLNVPEGEQYNDFYAGNMFWIRANILNEFKKCNWRVEDFEPSILESHWPHERDPDKEGTFFWMDTMWDYAGKAVDGQLAHAFERAIIPYVTSLGYIKHSIPPLKNISYYTIPML